MKGIIFLFIFTIASLGSAKMACLELLDSTASLDFLEKEGAVLAMDGTNRLAGDFRYDYNTENQDLNIGEVRVSIGYEGRGVYKKMLKLVLAAHPDVKTITSSLRSDNLLAYVSAKRNILRNRASRITLEEAGVEALKSTPAYKIRKAFGFSKIIEHIRREPDRSFMRDQGSLKMVVTRDEL